MTDDDKMTLRDLDMDEGMFLLRYRLLSDEDKEKLSELMEDLKPDNSNKK